jgi:hypothetical protein
MANQISNHPGQVIVSTFREAILNPDIRARDISGLFQALLECRRNAWRIIRAEAAKKTDYRYRRLLSRRRERPRNRTTKDTEKFAPLHASSPAHEAAFYRLKRLL